MDYSQFLSMQQEVSLLAVILLVFLADLFTCGRLERGEACSLSEANGSTCGCRFRTLFPMVLLVLHTVLNLLPWCCEGCAQACTGKEAFR